jgi:hypothetical protein
MRAWNTPDRAPDRRATRLTAEVQQSEAALGLATRFEDGNTAHQKKWTPIEEGCKACSREVGGGQTENRKEGALIRGGPTVPDSEGGVITSRLCKFCAQLWRADGKPNPWFPANGPGGSRGPKPRWRKPVGKGV